MDVKKRNTKIIATLGPSCEKVIDEILQYSDIIRINLAHSFQSVEKYINLIEGKVPILMDLPGSKLRVKNEREIIVRKGDIIEFGKDLDIDSKFYSLVENNDIITIGDGDIKLKIRKDNDKVYGLALNSGIIYPRRGLSIPKELPYGVTEEDLKILEKVSSLEPDYIGISFVTSDDDIKKIKDILGEKVWIIAKIERKESLKNLKKIGKASDGLMIARGDLGLEVGLSNLPFVQKYIINISNIIKKPVILATQVLESMINSPIPERAEITDIANSIHQGVDSILLSDETAIGNYPVKTLQVLDMLIRGIESRYTVMKLPSKIYDVMDSIYFSIITALKISKAKLIVIYSPSGKGVIRLSKLRPKVPVLALVENKNLGRKLQLCYGIYSIDIDKKIENTDELIKTSRLLALDFGLVKKNEHIIIAADDSNRIGNFLKIERIS
ncbi:pyruvate kinase [Acidianus sulfidivorans JP7]|uniref:Pyruvate kinase n=1 Tax=Acidianus sulfidivorans JP7 TaxID=619593 RepID=A0A2U9ILK4_9CREN|nr:pyruvate kinase [Acidianus sulfidivorans]AWR96901.1 pyruvate kinase [Acidianus sulfidivorans JP7]